MTRSFLISCVACCASAAALAACGDSPKETAAKEINRDCKALTAALKGLDARYPPVSAQAAYLNLTAKAGAFAGFNRDLAKQKGPAEAKAFALAMTDVQTALDTAAAQLKAGADPQELMSSLAQTAQAARRAAVKAGLRDCASG